MIMKKENMELKEVIKAAILEAFAEMYGVATLNDTDDSAPEDGEGSENNNGGSNNGGSNTAANSGGTPNNGRPKPNVGVGPWSMRS